MGALHKKRAYKLKILLRPGNLGVFGFPSVPPGAGGQDPADSGVHPGSRKASGKGAVDALVGSGGRKKNGRGLEREYPLRGSGNLSRGITREGIGRGGPGYWTLLPLFFWPG